MPELLVDFITSLDGYASAEGWPGFWGLEGPEYLAWLARSPEAEYTTLMGATTYRLMAGFAADSDDDGMAQLTAMSKVVVFSSTLEEPLEWANTRLVDEEPVRASTAVRSTAGSSCSSTCPPSSPVHRAADTARPERSGPPCHMSSRGIHMLGVAVC
jgi:hypothetical protein